MKKIFLYTLVFGITGFSASAQIDRKVLPRDTTKTAGTPESRFRQQNPLLFKELNLTTDQKKQLKANMDNAKEKIAEIRNNSALGPVEKRDQLIALREEQKKRMIALLTPAQKRQWEEAEKKMADGVSKTPYMGNVDKKTYDKVEPGTSPQ